MNNKEKSSIGLLWLIPVVAIGLGTAVGASSSFSEYREPEMYLAGHELSASPKGAQRPAIKDAKPRVYVVSEVEYDFGVMARNESETHSFKVQNIGSGPLTLKVLDTTCKCTVGSLGKDSIKPGETADVTLTWEAKSYDREFRQSATIETNDKNQREIIFSVYGKVLQLAMPDLPMVKFSRISRSEPQSFTTIVYGYRDTDLVITDHHFSNEETADFFTLTTEPLPRDKWMDSNAKSAIKVRVDIKPGLPVGIVRQLISLKTNKLDVPPMDVAVDISVVSDISVIGSRERYNDEKNTLVLGPVSAAKGHVEKMFLLVKGKHKDIVDITLASTDPSDALTAEIGTPREVKDIDDDGNEKVVARNFPMSIIVKPGSPIVQRLGSKQGAIARVVFDTKHPEIEQFAIKVQFSTH